MADCDAEQAFVPLSKACYARRSATHEAVSAWRRQQRDEAGRAWARRPPRALCGLLTIDAHLDLRSLDGGLSNGNPVRALLADGLPGGQIVQVGLQSFANSAAYAEVAREAGIHG